MKLIMTCVVALLFLGNAAAQSTLEGKLVKIKDNKLTITDKDGMLEVTYKIAEDAVVTCDGKECKANKLGKGCKVILTLKEEEGGKKIITKIKAISDVRGAASNLLEEAHLST
ncbi:MAG: hypothetical protein QM703_10595 [Gemmatales bacterium]